jgi:hypothetical protein
MIGNTCQDIGKPGTRIDIVEARGGNQRIPRRRSFAAAITAGEQPALPAESNHPFILPMSGFRVSSFAVLGAEIDVKRNGLSRANSTQLSNYGLFAVLNLRDLPPLDAP